MVMLLALFLVWSYALLGGFLIYVSIHKEWYMLAPLVKLVLLPFMLFYFVDIGFNFVFGTLLFLERPYELTLTQRCDRHLKDTGFRGSIARALCNHLLNPFEPDHCK